MQLCIFHVDISKPKIKLLSETFTAPKKKAFFFMAVSLKSLTRNKTDKKDFNCIIGSSDEKCQHKIEPHKSNSSTAKEPS